jgi:hypothetical protein
MMLRCLSIAAVALFTSTAGASGPPKPGGKCSISEPGAEAPPLDRGAVLLAAGVAALALSRRDRRAARGGSR